MQKKEVIIYTDGACRGNPGPGGWGAILIHNGSSKEISGFEQDTTNNRMELQAAIEALTLLKEPCNVTLYSDSNYLVQAFTQGWLDNWKMKGWKTASRSPVLNQDLWKKMDALALRHSITFVKVKGHSDDPLNNRADFLATSIIDDYVTKA